MKPRPGGRGALVLRRSPWRRSISSAASSSRSACSRCIRRRKSEAMMSGNIVALLYLVAGVLFILALRGLSNPETSRQGNRFGMAGMAIAIATTLAASPPTGPVGWGLVAGGLALGGIIGGITARRISMTAMPELVAAFHSLVG